MDMHSHESTPFWRSTGGIALMFVTLVGGFLLFTEHRAHVLGALPFLLLLSCPLMHRFMHHGHHHDHDTGQRQPLERQDEQPLK